MIHFRVQQRFTDTDADVSGAFDMEVLYDLNIPFMPVSEGGLNLFPLIEGDQTLGLFQLVLILIFSTNNTRILYLLKWFRFLYQ